MENNTTETSKSKIDKLEKEIEKLKISLEKSDEKLTESIKSRDCWKECAEYYAEKFQLAYKGFLMTQGKSETESHQESLKVLDKISSLK